MHPLVRLGLRLASLPIFSVKKNYTLLRKAQEAFAPEPEKEELEGFILMDEYLLNGEDESHLPVRVFIPKKELSPGLIIFLHGGGFVIGNVDTYTLPCARLATTTGRVVCSVDYRLAPEHPFPAALDDCLAVSRELAEYFTKLNDPIFRPLTIMGDSAGGNLATTVARLMQTDDYESNMDLQVLLYPAVSDDYSEHSPFPSFHEKGDSYGLTAQKMRDYYELYLPDPELIHDPRVSPLRADNLAVLPPALIITAEHDPLRDEGNYYAEKLRECGVETELKVYPAVPHGFFSHQTIFPEANEKLYQDVKEYLDRWEKSDAKQ